MMIFAKHAGVACKGLDARETTGLEIDAGLKGSIRLTDRLGMEAGLDVILVGREDLELKRVKPFHQRAKTQITKDKIKPEL